MNKSHFKEQAVAWLFLSPALIVLVAFGLFPIGYAFYVSLHRWRIKREAVVGFDHYLRAVGDPQSLIYFISGSILLWCIWNWKGRHRIILLLAPLPLGLMWVGFAGLLVSGDSILYNGFKVTFFYALGTIPIQLIFALVLAYLLFNIMRGKGFFRLIFFLPYVTPVIASAVVFRTIFSPHPSSIANRFWSWCGLERQRWLYEGKSVVALVLTSFDIADYPVWVDQIFPSLALVSIISYNIWVYVGYDTVILSGLSAIPQHYYEAASIDGANAWQVFRNITLPLISPTLFFLSMVAVIGTFKAFNHIYIMRTPGARESVDVVSVVIFDQIFQYHNAGYASTLAFILFIAILGLTVAQNRILGKRVFMGIRLRKEWIVWFTYTGLITGALLACLPFVWMLLASFMSRGETLRRVFVPKRIEWGNYWVAWNEADFGLYFENSLIVAVLQVFGTLLFSLMAAYPLARMQFKGREVVFVSILATLMIPEVVTMVPNFLTVTWLHRHSPMPWLNSWPALTIPFMASAFSIFLLRQFMRGIPEELREAARIDGAGHGRFLFQIVLPLCRAPLLTVGMFTFIGSWNSLAWPLLVTNTPTWRPISVGLQQFVSEAGSEVHLQMAGAAIATFPVLMAYFLIQKEFTEGISMSGLKG